MEDPYIDSFLEDQLYEVMEMISYEASSGTPAKKIAAQIDKEFEELFDYIGSGKLVADFVRGVVKALDVGAGLQIATAAEKKLYKQYPAFKYQIEAFLSDFTDMEMADEGSEFEKFWKRS